MQNFIFATLLLILFILGHRYPDAPSKIEIEILPNKECQKLISKKLGKLPPKSICAGGEKKKDTCMVSIKNNIKTMLHGSTTKIEDLLLSD